jgi:hypothetical protein
MDFRKTFVLLAILVAATMVVSAQSFQCAVNAGAPTIARQEGVAEEVGQVLLSCSGGTRTAADTPVPTVNVAIFLNTEITSRLLTQDGWSEALLLIDEPSNGQIVFCGQPGTNYDSTTHTCTMIGNPSSATPYKDPNVANAFQGKYSSAQKNSVVFNGIPIDPPGTAGSGGRSIRIVNVRANASAISSSSFIPGSITMYVAITGTGAPGIGNNAQQLVGYVQKGLAFSLRTIDDKAFTTSSLSQCNGNNTDAPDSGQGCYDFRARFTELFSNAFRPSGIGTAQDQISTIYNTESMFSNPAWPTLDTGNLAWAGQAVQGTQLKVTFGNIPAGVRIFVSDWNLEYINNNVNPNAAATRVDASDLATGTSGECTAGFDGSAYTELTTSNTATWEIQSANPSFASDVDFGVLISFSAASVTPTAGAANVTGSFAPINTQSPIMASYYNGTSGYPVPRFIDSGITPTDGFVINSCSTNLLFPFVTNQAGFDSGLAISNTSMAPTGFGGSQQAGSCIINYYGATSGGGAAPAAQTSGSVPSGGQLVFTLSAGGGVMGSENSVNPTPGFQGYVIAQCSFQYAHGYAFISDMGSQKLAEGYLALVMDAPVRSRTGSNSEVLAQ